MIFTNNTKIQDKILKKIVRCAGNSIGLNTKNTVVSINPGTWFRGLMTPCKYIMHNGKAINIDGVIKVTLPIRRINTNLIDDVTTQFFELLQHELQHVKDFKEGIQFELPKNGRRRTHGLRLEELRAKHAVFKNRNKKG